MSTIGEHLSDGGDLESEWHHITRGTGYIKGGPETEPDSGVFVLTVPAAKQVFLLHRPSMIVIRTKWSDSDGRIRFEYLINGDYVLTAWDDTQTYCDVIAGPVRPIWEMAISDPSPNAVVTLPVNPIITTAVADTNDLWIPISCYTVSHSAGTITFAGTLPSLSEFTSPFKAIYSY